MTIKLGPVLGFRGCDGGMWRLSALVATDEDKAPVFRLDAGGKSGTAQAKRLDGFKAGRTDLTLWRYDFQLKQAGSAFSASYALDAEKWGFAVPKAGAAPAIAYGSCNGFSSLKLMKSTRVPDALWDDLLQKHAKSPFHLLMLGGDQLYSDSMWEELEVLSKWAALPTAEGVKQPASETMKRQIADFFRGLYPKRWSQKAVAQALATIPTLMMWDDHDIMDGWGSYPKELHECDVYGAIFASARETFSLYQLQNAPGEPHPLTLPGQKHFTFGCRIGPLAILALDMRSERTLSQVMGTDSWKAVFDWLDAVPASDAGGPKHLFVMSSIPVVYPDFSILENALGIFPGRQELEDDLKDHWTSVPHRQERLRMIHRLLDFSTKNQCRVTLLSGDVHVGAVGTIQSERRDSGLPAPQVITQLTSSGIVHPAPPGMVLYFLENVVGKGMSDDRDITSEIVEIPGTRQHFIGARNWLALAPDVENRYWANWHAESEPYPFTKVIHPAGFKMADAKLKQPEP
jgi:hypothetical protein